MAAAPPTVSGHPSHVLHVPPAQMDPNIVSRPSVAVCTELNPYKPTNVYPGKTMMLHSRLQNVSGNTWKCLNCNTQGTSQ